MALVGQTPYFSDELAKKGYALDDLRSAYLTPAKLPVMPSFNWIPRL